MISLEMNQQIARVRRLANGGAIVYLPETGEVCVCQNVDGKIDLRRASRLSRGAAHRLVDAMTDADAEQKQTYHQLIDNKEISNAE